jgi:hypothetical protein
LGNPAVFVLEFRAIDVHAALSRLLDQARVAHLKLAAVRAEAHRDEYKISASLDVSDRAVVDRLAIRVGSLVCVGAVAVRGEPCGELSAQSAAP